VPAEPRAAASSLMVPQHPAPAHAGDRLPWHLSAFGLDVRLGFHTPGADPATGAADHADLVVRRTRREELEPLSHEPRRLRYLRSFDEMPYAMLEGSSGDLLLHCGEDALMHLDAERRTLRCAPSPTAGVRWQRVLTDTVLWTVSLLRGFELLHASAVATGAGLIALAGASGSGKSTLAAEFIRAGARLFADDLLALEDLDGTLIAHPGPPLVNLPLRLDPSQIRDASVIATFDGEHWVRLEQASTAPLPVAAVVLVSVCDGRSECVTLPASNLELLPWLIGFPHLQNRTRARFELSGLLAGQARLLRLRRGPEATPAELVALIESELGQR
jgi:hypothetical protein